MIYLDAKIFRIPHTIKTKNGDRMIAEATVGDGTIHTIWRKGGDQELSRISAGERVKISIDEYGYVDLVETAFSRTYSPKITPKTEETTMDNIKLPGEAENKLSQQIQQRLAVLRNEEQQQQQQQQQPKAISDRSTDIAEYVEKLGKLYSHCFDTANSKMGAKLDAPEVKDIATTLFIQTVRKFSL